MFVYPVLAVFNALVTIVSFVFNGLGGSEPDGTIFKNRTGELSDYYYTAITPAGWTFGIWGVIYAWQALWVTYSVVNIFRKTQSWGGGPGGDPVYSSPEFIPASLLALASITSALGVAWLVAFDRMEIEIAFVALVLYSFGMYASLAASYRALDGASQSLVQQDRASDIWLIRLLVQNGLALQAAWVSVATLLNLAVILTHSGGGGGGAVDADTAGTIALALLAVEIVVFSGADIFLLDRWTHYTLAPYGVLLLALGGSLCENYRAGEPNTVLTIVLMLVTSLVTAFKVVLIVDGL